MSFLVVGSGKKLEDVSKLIGGGTPKRNNNEYGASASQYSWSFEN